MRVDTFVEDGATIPPYYDSMIAKVVVRDETREAAIERARRVLGELEVRGVPTTRDIAIEILGSPEFRSGEYSTSFLDEVGALAARRMTDAGRRGTKVTDARARRRSSSAPPRPSTARSVRRPRRQLDDRRSTAGDARVELELSVAYGQVLPDAAAASSSGSPTRSTRMCGRDTCAAST